MSSKRKSKKTGKKREQAEEIRYKERRSSSRAVLEDGVEAGSASIGEVTAEGEKVKEESDKTTEMVDRIKRLQAEFENYRKRVQKERVELWSMAKRDFITTLLPFIDDMRRIDEWDDDKTDARQLLEGVRLTAKKLMSILREEGFERIDALGKPFDPNFHEALLIQEVDDPARDNIVDEVMVEGYLFNGTLLRPARVKVLRYKGEGNGEGDEGGDVLKDRSD